MPTREHVEKQSSDYATALSEAVTGDIIRIGRAPNGEFPDFRVCKQGVLCRIPGKGFFLINDSQPILVHRYHRESKDWFPYGENEILVVEDDRILFLHDRTKVSEVYKKGPWITCQPHIFTESVIGYDTKDSFLWISKHEARSRLTKKWKFWQGEFHTAHVQKFHSGKNIARDFGHPGGIVFYENGSFVLRSPSKEQVICSSTRSNPRDWIACAKGIVFGAGHGKDETLRFNDDPKLTFYEGHYERIIPTPVSCAVLNRHKLFLSDLPGQPLCEIAYDDPEYVMPHPHGILVYYDSQFSLIIIKDPLPAM
jgi:hypothetical protein